MVNKFEIAKSFFIKGEENFAKQDFYNAEKNFQSSLDLMPNRNSTLINLGLTKIKLRKLSECSKIINQIENNSTDEKDLDLLNLKSHFYSASNNFEKGIQTIDKILKFIDKKNKKKLSELYSNKGIAFAQLEDYRNSIFFQKKAVEVDNTNISASFFLGLQYLKKGNYEEGWKLYENRLKRNRLPELKYPKKIEDIKNKKVLIKFEQGFGDIMQFSRFINVVENYTHKIDFLIPKKLKDLFEFKYAQTIFAQNKPYDYEIYLCSLPYLLNINEEDLKKINYENFFTDFSELKKNSNKYRIGLVWSGSSSYQFDHLRSFTLGDLKPLLNNLNYNFYCLQKDVTVSDQQLIRDYNIINYGNLNFSDISSKIIELDLVISSCTSLLHLSSSLNKETWAMLPYSPDWRWLRNRNDSPWYKNLKIFKKNKTQNWKDLALIINNELKKKFY